MIERRRAYPDPDLARLDIQQRALDDGHIPRPERIELGDAIRARCAPRQIHFHVLEASMRAD